MSLDPVTDAVQRTTTAVTIVHAGYKVYNVNFIYSFHLKSFIFVLKVNIIPGFASAVINHRMFPTESLDSVLAHNKKIINDDRVKMHVKTYIPAVPVSPYGPDVPAFELIARSLKQVYPDSIVTAGK